MAACEETDWVGSRPGMERPLFQGDEQKQWWQCAWGTNSGVSEGERCYVQGFRLGDEWQNVPAPKIETSLIPMGVR